MASATPSGIPIVSIAATLVARRSFSSTAMHAASVVRYGAWLIFPKCSILRRNFESAAGGALGMTPNGGSSRLIREDHREIFRLRKELFQKTRAGFHVQLIFRLAGRRA